MTAFCRFCSWKYLWVNNITPDVNKSCSSFVSNYSRVSSLYVTSTTERFANVTYYVSGANVPGEGELKCIDWIKLNVRNPDDSVVVIGGDADLVLQGMALSQVCIVLLV